MSNTKHGGKVDKSLLRRSAALALVTGLATSGAAFAQEAAPPVETGEEEIVVTGSRLPTNEFTSPDPIQIVTTERGNLTGVGDIAELLQSSTLASGSAQVDATISSAFVTEGGPGTQTVSLRGLGASRTLVLINGRRGGPAGVRGQISAFDLNVVPFSAVERFEILKDGASSIYGSDAVAGVVNIITDRDIDGGEFNFTAIVPAETGGEEYRAEMVWGTTFNRGYFSVGLDYYLQKELTFGARGYTNCRPDYTFDAQGNRNDTIDPRTGQAACLNVPSGQVWLYEFVDDGPWNDTDGPLHSPDGTVLLQWDPSGQIGSLVPGAIIPSPLPGNPNLWPTVPQGVYAVGFSDETAGLVNSNPLALQRSSLIPELERFNVFMQAGYDITPNIEAYGEVLLSRRESKVNGFRQFWTFQYTYTYGDPVNTDWGGAAILSPTAVTSHNDSSTRVDYYRAVAGLRGGVQGWLSEINWDVFVQGSRSDAEYTDDQILADAVATQRYRTGSCVGTVTPISGRPCIDVNWNTNNFLNGVQSAEERAFLFDTETGHTTYDQLYVEGIATTDIVELPAGAVSGAVGFHVRREEIEDVPGEITLAGNAWNSTGAGITAGDDTTREVFGEVRVPIFAGAPLAEDVNLTLSGRWTDVESYGDDTTYKIGLNWSLTPEWRLRYTKGTSFRAPALFEQYLENQTGFLDQRQVDPCLNWAAALAAGNIPQRVADNCAADGIPDDLLDGGSGVTVTSGGGDDLFAETSEAWTAGLVWTPGFIDLSFAIDYFEIEVNNEVTQLGANVITYGCYNSPDFPNDPLCDLFERTPAGQPEEYRIETVTDDFINVASQVNRGFDISVLYQHEFAWGDLSIQGQATHQLEDDVSLVAGITRENNGLIGDPEWVANLDFRIDQGDWTYFWGIEWIGETSDWATTPESNDAGDTFYQISTDGIFYHDLSVRRTFDQWELTVGVANALDQEPPQITAQRITGGTPDVGSSALTSNYDYIGRRGFIRIGRSF